MPQLSIPRLALLTALALPPLTAALVMPPPTPPAASTPAGPPERPAAAAVLPPAPGREITTLTPRPGFYDEPSAAINPRDPREMAVAYQVGARVAYSRDGGRTWRAAAGATPADYKVSGDVSIAFDGAGRAFLCYIAFDHLGTDQYWGHDATRNGVFVRRSLDGGATWAAAVPVDAQPTRPGRQIPFEDKPYLVADQNPAGGRDRFAGSLYVGWTEFTLSQSVILFSYSRDGGLSWSAPRPISAQPGLPRDDNGAVEGFAGVVTPDGALRVVWSNGRQIICALSRDGGQTFSRNRVVAATAPSYFSVSGVARANGFPQISAAPARGRRGDELYLAWSDYRNGEVDVFLARSRDGRHWSPPEMVSPGPAHDGTDHFFQWMAADPVTGDVYVVFYGRSPAAVGPPPARKPPRPAPAPNQRAAVVLARSTDEGRAFSHYVWSDAAFAPSGAFLGDYLALAARAGTVLGAWTVVPPPAPLAPPSPAPAPAPTPANLAKPLPPSGKLPPQSPRSRPESNPDHLARIGTLVRVGLARF